MSDEMEALRDRARSLEEENALLRSMQPARGGEAALLAENALLRRELAMLRGPAKGGAAGAAAGAAAVPRTIEEFRTLLPAQRQAAALNMSRQQRDEMLGREGGVGREGYL